MTRIVIDDFGGIAPTINARKLADKFAQTADRTYLKAGTLAPLRSATSDSGKSQIAKGAKSMFLYQGDFEASTRDKSYAKVPIANDSLDRIVVTDHTHTTNYPIIKSGASEYRLGIPQPGVPTIVSVTAPSDPNGLDAEDITYVVTLVDAWGAEGPPSDPATITERQIDTDVTVLLPSLPSGSYNFSAGALFRLYRSNSGTDSTSYQFAGEFAVSNAGANVTDTKVNALLGEVIPSVDWIGPPDDDTTLYPNGPLEQVVNLPNGVLAGFAHKTICFTDPFLYHAWPASYRITLEDEIVGIMAIASGLVVTTKRKPYLVTGVDPAAMTLIELDVNQSCVSKKSMVDMGEYGIYASPDGLVLVSGTRAEVLTKGYYNREQWQDAWEPSNLIAFYWEGYYLAYNGDIASGPKGFMLNLVEGDVNFVTLGTHQIASAGFYDAESDTTFFVLDDWDGTGNVFPLKFAQSILAPEEFTWRSKEFVLPRPECMTVVRVDALEDIATKPVTIKVFADGDYVNPILDYQHNDLTNVYTNDQSFLRLPSTGKHRAYAVEVFTENEISRIVLASSMQELT
jgi:hypothetical protein